MSTIQPGTLELLYDVYTIENNTNASAYQKTKHLIDSNYTRSKPINMMLVPHGNLSQCGSILGNAYSSIDFSNIEVVVILTPKHLDKNELHKNIVSLPQASSFKCYPHSVDENGIPREEHGELNVEKKLIQKLALSSNNFSIDDFPFLYEHGLDIHLPFLNVLKSNIKIVPMIISRMDPNTIRNIADAIKSVFKKIYSNVLFIISTNMGSGHSIEDAEKNSNIFLSELKSNRNDIFTDKNYWYSKYDEKACGWVCAAIMLMTHFFDNHKIEFITKGIFEGVNEISCKYDIGDGISFYSASAIAFTKNV